MVLGRMSCRCLCCIVVTGQFSLVVGMVTRCHHVSSYMCVVSFYVCTVCFIVLLSLSGLHSITDI